jgi:hypothetical protein
VPESVQWVDLVIVGVFYLLLLAFSRNGFRRVLGAWAVRATHRLAARPAPGTEPDPEVEALARSLRRQRLRHHVERVAHLISTDSWMSATRQLGNRLAYEQLLAELRRLPGDDDELVPERWAPVPALRPVGAAPQPAVEVLDLGWHSDRLAS